MSRLSNSKTAVATALVNGGLTVAVTGKFAAPCVLVEPGEPWASADNLGRKRTARWRLTIVAGRADTAGNQEKLAELVDTVDAALLTIPGVQLPNWGRPFDASLEGIVYAVTMATIQHMTEEG
jgi:hypothetical protein